jgi:hypothetical protein
MNNSSKGNPVSAFCKYKIHNGLVGTGMKFCAIFIVPELSPMEVDFEAGTR